MTPLRYAQNERSGSIEGNSTKMGHIVSMSYSDILQRTILIRKIFRFCKRARGTLPTCTYTYRIVEYRVKTEFEGGYKPSFYIIGIAGLFEDNPQPHNPHLMHRTSQNLQAKTDTLPSRTKESSREGVQLASRLVGNVMELNGAE